MVPSIINHYENKNQNQNQDHLISVEMTVIKKAIDNTGQQATENREPEYTVSTLAVTAFTENSTVIP